MLDALGRFARDALELEKATPAGRINALGMAVGLAVMTAGGALNLLEAVVRIADNGYRLDKPPLVAIFAIFAGYTLLCVLMLAMLEQRD